MTFTHLDDEGDSDVMNEMQKQMELGTIQIVTPEEAEIYGFEELSQWAQEKDVLLLVDDVLLLCLPKAECTEIIKAA